MSNLYMNLPSFATDYSGFVSIMHGLGGLMIVHDPSGCLGNYTNCDEPRWYNSPQRVFSTGYREMDAVLGENNDAIEKICNEVDRRKPPFTCILGTPIPSLTGCDFNSIAREVENKTGVPCFGIETDGFKFYTDGIKRAMRFLIKNVVNDNPTKIKHSVNILGMTPLDYSSHGEVEALKDVIESYGWYINSLWGMGDNLKSIKNSRVAEKNIVMCAAAIPVAEEMFKEGIPYWVGPPIGENGIRELKEFLLNENELIDTPKNASDEKVLIIGEQAIANALRRHIQSELDGMDVTVASFFDMDSSIKMAQDLHFESETQLEDALQTNDFDIVIGDNLFKSQCPNNISFVAMPHPAISSKIYWKTTRSIIGDSPIDIKNLEVKK